jgi:hypothetical protein
MTDPRVSQAAARALLGRVAQGGGMGADEAKAVLAKVVAQPVAAPVQLAPQTGVPQVGVQSGSKVVVPLRPHEAAQQAGQDLGVPGTGVYEPVPIHEPGGDLLRKLLHPQFVPFEELYRVLPDDSWFQPSVSPNQPIQFELGSFTVPNGQQLWVFDYEFSVFRFSGTDPGDFVKAEAGRFAGVMGFDITVNGRRPSHLLYQLDPVPVVVSRQSFQPQGQTNNADFTRSASNSFAANASPALSLLPVRRAVQGVEGGPFTMIAKQGDKVALSCVIFEQVKTPIAAVEARHMGFLLQTNLAETLLNRMRPR